MSGPVLVLGGYGVFGGRVAERLAASGFQVIVAGRSLAKAARFADGRPGLTPARVDRNERLALADVPDLALSPDRLPGAPSVVFRAGVEHRWQVRGLALLAWAVRLGAFRDARRLAPLLDRVRGLLKRFGSERSAMQATVAGRRAGRRIERRWTLIAEDGCGPQIPTLATPLLIGRIAKGQVEPGAPVTPAKP